MSWAPGTTRGSLKIINCRAFRQGLGEAVHLIGEVQNTGDEAMGGVMLKAEGIGLGRVLDARAEPAFVDPIAPGEKVPFRIFLDMREVEKVRVSAEGETTDAKPAETLEVLDVKMTPPASGYTHVQGQVKNTQGKPVAGVRLVAVVRDGAGDVLDVVEADLEGSLEAGASKSFDLIVMHRDAVKAEVRAEVKTGTP